MTKNIEEVTKELDKWAVQAEKSILLYNKNTELDGDTFCAVCGNKPQALKEHLISHLTTLSIKIHEEAIKELEGLFKREDVITKELPEVQAHNQAIDEAITYHRNEIKKLT